MPGELNSAGAFELARAAIAPVSAKAAQQAAERQATLTKPAGALGRLEDVSIALSAIAGVCPPPVPSPATVAVFAGDHGVLKQGVSPWPAEVTAQMVLNFVSGGAAVNVLARHVGATVVVVDVGVASDLPRADGLVNAKIRRGTADLSVEPAMSVEDAWAALDVGAKVAADAVGTGSRCLLTGDMGIGNTTPSAALVGYFTGHAADEVTGRGTGIDDERLALKVAVVDRALERTRQTVPTGEAIEALASLGGLEIAALAGYIVGGAAAGVPVLLDGVIAVAAAVSTVALAPQCRDYLFAGHLSSEPAAAVGLGHLGLDPLVDLGLRLGEGSGACLALPLLQSAALILRDMATFDSAGVSEDHV